MGMPCWHQGRPWHGVQVAATCGGSAPRALQCTLGASLILVATFPPCPLYLGRVLPPWLLALCWAAVPRAEVT